MLRRDDRVTHARHGTGRVRGVDGDTAVVRFDHGLEECLLSELGPAIDPTAAAESGHWSRAEDVVLRMQAEAARSVSDAWGILCRSRIELLPHQIWVARQILHTWPAGWLVADDVGLGKTVEAGLVLQALVSRGTVRRALVLCPAGLVEQWQYRLRDMFDLRLDVYRPELDTGRSDFWGGEARQVAASLQTLKREHRGRRERLLAAEPWDIVMVDEAHHLSAPEEGGETLGYELVRELQAAGRVRTLIGFTGTPHRGDTSRFLALMRLVREDLFDPEWPADEQLGRLGRALIRNNKLEVTDLQGRRLFRSPVVRERQFAYSSTEAEFYETLTRFLRSGRGHADTLSGESRSAANLLLTTFQKLASSSVAAVRRALQGRLDRLVEERTRREHRRRRRGHVSDGPDSAALRDEAAVADAPAGVRLAAGEEVHLRHLLSLASAIRDESRFAAILGLLDGPFEGRSVLVFTEYKATQAALLEAIAARHGEDAVAFINGDEAVESWSAGGRRPPRLWRLERAKAAGDFNAGRVRYLVSTEAGGEGIDLQERCHCLIHADLPWNPMRLHQRVGRLNRFGQSRQVEVYSVRNPETIEGRIWDQLREKLDRISRQLAPGMDDPEDLLPLVLGMTDPRLFDALFAGPDGRRDAPPDWVAGRLESLGALETCAAARALDGAASHFDFNACGGDFPRIDLGALEPFLRRAMSRHGVAPSAADDGWSFSTPPAWARHPGVRSEYSRMIFDRQFRGDNAAQRVLGIGHRVVDIAVEEARGLSASAAVIPPGGLPGPLAVLRVTDRLTGTGAFSHATVLGAVGGVSGTRLLRDWEVLTLLNGLPLSLEAGCPTQSSNQAGREQVLSGLKRAIQEFLPSLNLPYSRPHLELICSLWPAASWAAPSER